MMNRLAILGTTRNTAALFRPLWDANISAAKHLVDDTSFGELYGKWRRYEAILCGFGPSIQEQAGLLKSFDRGRFKLVAVDVAFKWLVKNGMRPDMVMMTDARNNAERVFLEDGKPVCDLKGILLAATATCDAETMKCWQKKGGSLLRFLILDSAEEWKRHLRHDPSQKNFLASGGNVTSLGFSLVSDQLEARRILLVGNEMCWKTKKYLDEDLNLVDALEGKKSHRVKDALGFDVWTDSEYEFYAHWLDHFAGLSGKNLYDCSPYGLLGAEKRYKYYSIEGNVKKRDLADMLLKPYEPDAAEYESFMDMALESIKPKRAEVIASLDGEITEWRGNRLTKEYRRAKEREWRELRRRHGNPYTAQISYRENIRARVGRFGAEELKTLRVAMALEWDKDQVFNFIRDEFGVAI